MNEYDTSEHQRFILDSLTHKEHRIEYIKFTPSERQLYNTLMKEGRKVNETMQIIMFIRGDETTIFTGNTGLKCKSPEPPKKSVVDDFLDEYRQLREDNLRLYQQLATRNRELKAQGNVIRNLSTKNIEYGELVERLQQELTRIQ